MTGILLCDNCGREMVSIPVGYWTLEYNGEVPYHEHDSPKHYCTKCVSDGVIHTKRVRGKDPNDQEQQDRH